ncbi:membrane protein [Maridesulfovibrio bastinii]|uniref:membrane protein n=1 Tax=Maridesulfovibrio bastinii TaxID=47157 RepID=UPI00040F2562|nr:membrane protein [Maridesulfovibrio bastinii]
METAITPALIWHGLGYPLVRLIFFISLGLLVGNIVEGLRWTRAMGRLAKPLVKAGRLKDISGASFALAFFSGIAANSMLSEAYENGRINDRELIVSNLFNSLPTYFLHMPTVFFIAAPFIGNVAFIYVGITFAAACLRTVAVVLWGRFSLEGEGSSGDLDAILNKTEKPSIKSVLQKAWKRFKRRLPKIVYITVPIYTAFFFLKHYGFFEWFERYLSGGLSSFTWFNPQTLGIIAFSIASEFTAGLAAAGSLLHAGSLSPRGIVIALLVGNILSTPMRAVRHQLPYYAGIFNGRLALKLMGCNQILRALSLIVVGSVYVVLTS